MLERRVLDESIRKFIGWLDRNGTAGYDPYDLWSTRFGTRARRLYYRFGNTAALLSAPLVLADQLAPRAARIGIPKKTYATAHAHLILAYLNLYESGFNGGEWLDRARSLAVELDRMKIDGYSGDCWGYPFDWENRRGFWPKNTPLITVTPYCFEAYCRLYEAAGEEIYSERAFSIMNFALRDLKNTIRPSGAIASSYSRLDESLVINASAYRAFVLMKSSVLFSTGDAGDMAMSLVRFVLESQRDDGSWPYALEEKGDDFVDHFHTCFVLKNLVKIHEVVPDGTIWKAIEKGHAYYERALFDRKGLPRPFSEGGNRLLKYNLYDFAEAINLGHLLRDRLPGAFEMAIHIAGETAARFQLTDGHFVTSVGRTGFADKVPYIRWPQAQMFHAFTCIRKSLN